MMEGTVCGNCGKGLGTGAIGRVCPACLLARGRVAMEERPRPEAGGFEPPAPGDLEKIFPDYEVRRLVGRGGMGAVYLAVQRDLEREVALKILPPEVANELEFQERFRREAATLAKLDHPNIVRLYDFGEREGYFYFIMEYVEGADLSALMADGEFSLREILAMIGQVCDALDEAHRQGVVHRDIKPGNILIAEDGTAKIVDFGLAKMEDPFDPGLTRTMSTMGTVQYMSPEQMAGLKQSDHRSDIYSLGVVLYELLTGKVPAGNFQLPSERRKGLGPRLDELVLKALQEDPEQRPQRATEVKEGLAEAVARPGPSSGALTLRVMVAAVVASALVLGIFAWSLRSGEPQGPGPVEEREVFPVTRIGADGTEMPPVPVTQNGLAQVSLSGADEGFGVGIDQRGQVVAWGANRYGQASPPTGLTAREVTAGQGSRNAHALALRADGTVVGWGDDTFGQATPPPGLEDVVEIAAGETFSLALTAEGEAVAWGNPTLPVRSGLKMIATGARFAAGLAEDGTVEVWGDGPTGVAGKGRMLAAGHRHLLVLGLDGKVRAWGENSRGQCEVPEDLPEIAAVFAGAHGSAAVDPDGKAYFWGVAVEMGAREFDGVREVVIGRREVLLVEKRDDRP